jgi:hypothetical protein
MNTIPTTSKRPRIPYTVVSGGTRVKQHKIPGRISLLILNQGNSLYKTDLLTELEHLGFNEIISIENPGVSYDVENISRKIPSVKFLLLQESCNTGEQINIGIKEAESDFVFVIWNNMKMPHTSLSVRLVDYLYEEKPLCTVPVLKNMDNNMIPSISVPAFQKNSLKMIFAYPKRKGVKSLFPFDYTGIYCREKFLYCGGYDTSINNSYWQKMDFGMRINLWEERIVCFTALQVSYAGDSLADDNSIDKNYRIFYLKNMAVRFNGDSGYLPRSRFLRYFLRSGEDLFHARRNFKEARKWVELNKFRFKFDCRSLTELWKDPDE